MRTKAATVLVVDDLPDARYGMMDASPEMSRAVGFRRILCVPMLRG